jgi:hypothetical protein
MQRVAGGAGDVPEKPGSQCPEDRYSLDNYHGVCGKSSTFAGPAGDDSGNTFFGRDTTI